MYWACVIYINNKVWLIHQKQLRLTMTINCRPMLPASASLQWHRPMFPASARGQFNQPLQNLVNFPILCCKDFCDHCAGEQCPWVLCSYSIQSLAMKTTSEFNVLDKNEIRVYMHLYNVPIRASEYSAVAIVPSLTCTKAGCSFWLGVKQCPVTFHYAPTDTWTTKILI